MTANGTNSTNLNVGFKGQNVLNLEGRGGNLSIFLLFFFNGMPNVFFKSDGWDRDLPSYGNVSTIFVNILFFPTTILGKLNTSLHFNLANFQKILFKI